VHACITDIVLTAVIFEFSIFSIEFPLTIMSILSIHISNCQLSTLHVTLTCWLIAIVILNPRNGNFENNCDFPPQNTGPFGVFGKNCGVQTRTGPHAKQFAVLRAVLVYVLNITVIGCKSAKIHDTCTLGVSESAENAISTFKPYFYVRFCAILTFLKTARGSDHYSAAPPTLCTIRL
jgi:hypothetical protein